MISRPGEVAAPHRVPIFIFGHLSIYLTDLQKVYDFWKLVRQDLHGAMRGGVDTVPVLHPWGGSFEEGTRGISQKQSTDINCDKGSMVMACGHLAVG